MTVAHSAPPWGGKSCASDGASQVVIGITVAARKMRAGEPEDVLDLSSGSAPREQIPGDPQIQDAPVGLRKALQNTPSLHTILVDLVGLFGAGGSGLCESRVSLELGWMTRRWWALPDGLQHRLATRRQTRTGLEKPHPWSVTVPCASSGFLISESGEPSQVSPVGAGQIAPIKMGQVLACRGRDRRLQRRGAEANPSLQMAGTGLHHHTRVMSIGVHPLHHCQIRTVQVDENIAGVLVSGARLDVHVASFRVTNAQKPDDRCAPQLVCCPQPLTWKGTACWLVNQTDQVQFVGHRSELAADRPPSQKKSTVVHDRNFAIEATRRTINIQRTAYSVLTVCLTPGGRFTFDPVCCRRLMALSPKFRCTQNHT